MPFWSKFQLTAEEKEKIKSRERAAYLKGREQRASKEGYAQGRNKKKSGLMGAVNTFLDYSENVARNMGAVEPKRKSHKKHHT
jgi:hypothetical protein